MADHLFGVIELALVFGGAIAWGLWEVHATRRESKHRQAAANRPEGDDTGPRA